MNISKLKLHTYNNNLSRFCPCDIVDIFDSYEYLRVMNDKRMRWSAHVVYLKKKLANLYFRFTDSNELFNKRRVEALSFFCLSITCGWGNNSVGGVYRYIF